MDENKIREIARTVCDNYAQNGLCFIDGDICDNVVCKYYKGAKALLEQGYRKESDTAREFAKTIKSVVWEEFENETIRIKDLHGVIDDILRSKYGVDLGE